jgi:hypothetical protein
LNATKKQLWHYIGKKKCHTQKSQVIAEMTTENILSETFFADRKHDFQLFKKPVLFYRRMFCCWLMPISQQKKAVRSSLQLDRSHL